MTRAEAKALGLRYYDPQRPCPKGHTLGVWLTSRGRCQECMRLENARPENRVRALAWQASPAGKAKVKAIKERFRASHPERLKEYRDRPDRRARQLQTAIVRYHQDREKHLARKRTWRQAHPEKMRLWDVARKEKRAQATYFLPEHLPLVAALYNEARRRRLQVDHIVPLKGRNVCGLHILCNLQLLTWQENRAKGNSHPSD